MKLHGIKPKLILVITFAVLVTAVLLTGLTNVLISLTFNLSLKERSEETAKIVTQFLNIQGKQLAVAIETLAGDSQFQQDYSFESWDHIQQTLKTQRAAAKASAIVVINLKGDLVAASVAEGAAPAALLNASAVTTARASGAPASTIETIGGRSWIFSVKPLVYFDQTVGYGLIGMIIDQAFLRQMKESSGADVVLFAPGIEQIGTCTLDKGSLERIRAVEANIPKEGVLPIKDITSEGTALLASAMPLPRDPSRKTFLLLGLSGKQAAAIRKRVTNASVAMAAVVAIIAALIGMYLAGRISNPIVEIARSFTEIAASRDLTRRIVDHYPDEIGEMAGAFNQMQSQVESLHQRVATAEQRMRTELDTASVVQEMLFPATLLEARRCSIASYISTSTETGGDWYSILDSPTNNATSVIIADVTGHGVAAALVTAILHGFFQAHLEQLAVPGDEGIQNMLDASHKLNSLIYQATRGARGLSMLVMTFDHRTLRLSYLNAGHSAPVIIRPQEGNEAAWLSIIMPSSSLIGQAETASFHTGTFQLERNDKFLVFTDGLVECTNGQNVPYGPKRLRQLVRRNGHLGVLALRDVIRDEVFRYFDGTPPEDDITFVVGQVRD